MSYEDQKESIVKRIEEGELTLDDALDLVAKLSKKDVKGELQSPKKRKLRYDLKQLFAAVTAAACASGSLSIVLDHWQTLVINRWQVVNLNSRLFAIGAHGAMMVLLIAAAIFFAVKAIKKS